MSPTSSSASFDGHRPNLHHEWELSKENAAPLERGRNVDKLSKALSAIASRTTSVTESTRFEKETKMFESLVKPSERFAELYAKKSLDAAANGTEVDAAQLLSQCAAGKDKDPVIHWISYIKHHEEHNPTDTQTQFLLLERCTRALLHHPLYTNDVRFIRNCVLYADKTSSPSEIFKFLHQNKVGSRVALFWVAWAWVAEKSGDYPFAEKVFKKGKDKMAEPLKLLEERHRQFQRRMSRKWLNAATSNNGDNVVEREEEEHVDQENRRGALSGLTEEGVRYNIRSMGANSKASTRQNRANVENTGRVGDLASRRLNHSDGRSTTVAFSARATGLFSHGRQEGAVPANNCVASKTTFDIFVENDDKDDGSDDGYNLDQSVVQHNKESRNSCVVNRFLTRNEDRKKENIARPERWNERDGLHLAVHGYRNDEQDDDEEPTQVPSIIQRWGHGGQDDLRLAGGTTAPRPAFQVFVDEECIKKSSSSDINRSLNEEVSGDRTRIERDQDRSLRQRLESRVADKLARDPLRYFRNPSKLASDKDKADCLVSSLFDKQRGGKPNKCGTSKSVLLRKDDSLAENHQLIKQVTSDCIAGADISKSFVPSKSDSKDCKEWCVEEKRAKAKYYKLVLVNKNVNLLRVEKDEMHAVGDNSEMDIDEEFMMDNGETNEYEHGLVDIDQTTMLSIDGKAASSKTSVQGQNLQSVRRILTPRKVLFGVNTSFESYNNSYVTNTSIASSTLNVRDAVGIVGDKEETINTKFAMRELSMMFSSPAVECADDVTDEFIIGSSRANCNKSTSFVMPLFSSNGTEHSFLARVASTKKPGQEHSCENTASIEEVGDTATFSIVADLIDSSTIDQMRHRGNSDEEDSDIENRGPRNISIARSNNTRGFGQCALRSMSQPEMAQDDAVRNVLGHRNADEHLTNGMNESEALQLPSLARSFQIFCDEQQEPNDESQEESANHTHLQRTGPVKEPFVIYQDDGVDSFLHNSDRKTSSDSASYRAINEQLKNLTVNSEQFTQRTATSKIFENSNTLLLTTTKSVQMQCRPDASTDFTIFCDDNKIDDDKKEFLEDDRSVEDTL